MAEVIWMADQLRGKDDWEETVTARLEELLSDMGWTVDMFATQLFGRIGASSKKAVIRYFEEDRRSIPAFSLFHISMLLGVSQDYLTGRITDKALAVDPTGAYARESSQQERIRELEKENAKLRAGTKRNK